MINFFKSLCFSFLLMGASKLVAQEYLSQSDFLEQALEGDASIKALWLSADMKVDLDNKLQQSVSGARVRYWETATHKRAWILEEIGRDKPITMGFVIHHQKITQLKILAFRESRGYEVRYPRFTAQFTDLAFDKQYQLNHSIDNITGATLSVNAVKKAAKLALFLNEQVDLTSSSK